MVRRLLSAGLAVGLLAAPWIARAASDSAVPEAPALPERLQSGQVMEPDVTITRGKQRTIIEYRTGGELREIKVVPDVGPPYYLVPVYGQGRFEGARNGPTPLFLINTWKIFNW